jgi:hypothetical protein
VKAAWATTLLTAVALAVGATAAPAAHSDVARAIDCAGDPGDPVPGTIEWDQADLSPRLRPSALSIEPLLPRLRARRIPPELGAGFDAQDAAFEGDGDGVGAVVDAELVVDVL